MSDDSLLSLLSARLPDSRFVAVEPNASTFEDVSRRGARFLDAVLSGATSQNVGLASASIADVKLEGMRINGVLVSDLFRAYSQLNPT